MLCEVLDPVDCDAIKRCSFASGGPLGAHHVVGAETLRRLPYLPQALPESLIGPRARSRRPAGVHQRVAADTVVWGHECLVRGPGAGADTAGWIDRHPCCRVGPYARKGSGWSSGARLDLIAR